MFLPPFVLQKMIIKILQNIFLLIPLYIASANAEDLKNACMEQGLKLQELAEKESVIAEESLTKEGNATPKALNHPKRVHCIINRH